MKIKDIVKKVHWFSSSTLAIVMLVIFIFLFVISFSRVLNQKEVLVKEVVVASTLEDSNKTDELKKVDEVVSTKSDESNNSVEVIERPELEEVVRMHNAVVASDEEEGTEELAPYKGEKSYEKVRNKLLSEGWLLLERSEFSVVKSGKDLKSGDGKTVSCGEATLNLYAKNWHPGEKPRKVLTRFCWKEQLVSKKITKKYKELVSDRYWGYEDMFMADFVHPNNKEFENKVRHISFSACNIGRFYECSGKPKSYLEMSHDRILTIAGAKTEYLNGILIGYVPTPLDTD
jgi:hypothetical protein